VPKQVGDEEQIGALLVEMGGVAVRQGERLWGAGESFFCRGLSDTIFFVVIPSLL
jgi:hypothetical protein